MRSFQSFLAFHVSTLTEFALALSLEEKVSSEDIREENPS